MSIHTFSAVNLVNDSYERAAHRITLLQGEIAEFYANFHVSRDLLDVVVRYPRDQAPVHDCVRADRGHGPRCARGWRPFYRRAGWSSGAIENYQARFGNFGKYIHALPESYRRIKDGEEIRIGANTWRVIVGTGHSPEHACLYCANLKLLISGDQVLPRISSGNVESRADLYRSWPF